jgi:phosphohistidine phosphatase SixA
VHFQQDLASHPHSDTHSNKVVPIEFKDCLIYGSDPMLTLELIMSLDVESVLLCSHMPLVSELAHLFAPGAMTNGFSTAEIVKIRYDKKTQHGVVVANVASNELN